MIAEILIGGGLYLAYKNKNGAVKTRLNPIYDNLFIYYGSKTGVDWQWLKAIAINESSLGAAVSVKRGIENPQDVEGSRSIDGKSWGLMQLTLPTAKDMDATATPEKLNIPEYSVDLASRYVAWLKKRFNPKDPQYIEQVIKSYNQGPTNTVNEFLGKNPGYAHEYWEKFKRNLERVKA